MKRKTKLRIERRLACYKHIVANHIFDGYYYRGLDETVKRIEKYRGVISRYVEALNTVDKYPWPASETLKAVNSYGYKNLNDIDGNLAYISDRFSCQFRLIWMLGIPKNYHNLKKSA